MKRFRNRRARLLPMALCSLLLGACASRAPERAPPPDFDAAAAVAAIRAAGTASGGELDVQPLRDPQVSDLSEEATRLEAGRLYQAAADRLDQALEISAQDPNLLQQRAEIALLLGQADLAERLALQARAAGTDVGPLCRRNWETVVRARAGGSRPPDAAGLPRVSVEEAGRRRDACTVAPPPRY